MAQRVPVWLDCDPGHDDAFAIILLGHDPGAELLGISTSYGNQTVEKTTLNALRVCALAGLSVRVVAGAAKPFLRPGRECPEIHGESGLDGPALPQPTQPALDGKAIQVMAEALLQASAAGRQPVLVCTGALTNAALLLSVYPELMQRIRLVLMGGALGAGNTGPCAEFNLQLDPEAAAMVFQSGVDLTMIPLEVTHTALATPLVLQSIDGLEHSEFRRVIVGASPPKTLPSFWPGSIVSFHTQRMQSE